MSSETRGACARTATLAAVAGTLSCAPSIQRFEAQPNVICAGTPVTLSWHASTSGELAESPLAGAPSDDDTTDVDADGSREVRPRQPTKYRLVVDNWFGDAAREVDVDVRTGEEVPIGESVAHPSAGCDATHVWVEANAPRSFWDARVRVGSVASVDDRPLRIEHGGLSDDLAAGATSTKFAGQEIAGPWKLVATLRAGESCGTPNMPRVLGFRATTACTP
jgi:hypothetical protein